jgi:hypothetical protein
MPGQMPRGVALAARSRLGAPAGCAVLGIARRRDPCRLLREPSRPVDALAPSRSDL